MLYSGEHSYEPVIYLLAWNKEFPVRFSKPLFKIHTSHWASPFEVGWYGTNAQKYCIYKLNYFKSLPPTIQLLIPIFIPINPAVL